jgi:hypothetical protein
VLPGGYFACRNISQGKNIMQTVEHFSRMKLIVIIIMTKVTNGALFFEMIQTSDAQPNSNR